MRTSTVKSRKLEHDLRTTRCWEFPLVGLLGYEDKEFALRAGADDRSSCLVDDHAFPGVIDLPVGLGV